MDIGLEYFRWQCFEGGYEWRDAESINQQQESDNPDHRDKRFLLEKGETGQIRLYHPLVKHPTLFKEFASIEGSEQVFAEFAGRYGLLGVGHLLALSGPVRTGEPLSRWWTEWSQMRAVVEVLDAIQSLDATRLEKWIDLRENQALIQLDLSHGYKNFGVLTRPAEIKPWLWKYSLGATTKIERLARLASGWAQEQINTRISGDDEAAVPSRILMNDQRGAFTLHMVPNGLLAAMWLQCARVLTVKSRFRACQQCGTWFELSADRKRKQTKYCSDRCKVAAYRNRKVAVIPMACPRCAKKLIVECSVTTGFGYMNFYPVPCPHCHQITERQLPNDIVDVRAE